MKHTVNRFKKGDWVTITNPDKGVYEEFKNMTGIIIEVMPTDGHYTVRFERHGEIDNMYGNCFVEREMSDAKNHIVTSILKDL